MRGESKPRSFGIKAFDLPNGRGRLFSRFSSASRESNVRAVARNRCKDAGSEITGATRTALPGIPSPQFEMISFPAHAGRPTASYAGKRLTIYYTDENIADSCAIHLRLMLADVPRRSLANFWCGKKILFG